MTGAGESAEPGQPAGRPRRPREPLPSRRPREPLPSRRSLRAGMSGRSGMSSRSGRSTGPLSRWRARVRAVVLLLIALIGVDAVSGIFYRTSTQSSVGVFRHGTAAVTRVIVVLPGHLMSGRGVGEAFQPYLADGDAVIAADYSERGVDLDDVRRRVLTALAVWHPTRLVVYGPSMGGVAAAGFLRGYAAAGGPYGKVTLVLDTAPSSDSDVKRPAALLWAGCYLHGGLFSSLAMAVGSSFSSHPQPEPGSDSAVIARANDAGAWRGTAAATTQACFVYRSVAPAAREFDAVVQSATYLHGTPAGDDPIIDVPAAVANWRVAFPSLHEVVLPGRQGSWHVSPIERPRETLAAILAAAGA